MKTDNKTKILTCPLPGTKLHKMATTNKKTISTRVTPEVEEFLADQYGSASAGLAACANLIKIISDRGTSVIDNELVEKLSILGKIRQYSTVELKGVFTKEEWFFFADSLNGTMIDSPFRCNAGALVAHCEDSELYEGTAKKYKIILEKLIEKVKKLTGAQVDAVYTHVEKFWDTESRDLEAWAEEL